MRKIHLKLDIKNFLKHSSNKDLEILFTDDYGKTLTANEAKDFLLDELLKGHKFLPIGECNNFDFEKGCLGHPIVK